MPQQVRLGEILSEWGQQLRVGDFDAVPSCFLFKISC